MTTRARSSIHPAAPEPSGSLDARGEASRRLHGPWLAIARLAWATAALLFVGLFVASLRAYVLQLGTVTDMERVLHMTVPPRFEFAIDVANMLAALAVGLLCFALAAVIFWRMPHQRM